MNEDRLKLNFNRPAEAWEEAMPIGNGRMGAMIFGRPAVERIQFNEETLWTGRPHCYDRLGSGDVLERIRELVASEPLQGSEAETELLTLVRSRFLSDPIRQKRYQPFGDIELGMTGHHEASDYSRSLDLRNAIAATRYVVAGVQHHRQWLASYPANAVIGHLGASRPRAISASIRLTCPHLGARTWVEDDRTIVLAGRVADPTDGTIGLSFESRLFVRAHGGNVTATENALHIVEADELEMMLVASTSFVRFDDVSADPSARCQAMLAHIAHRPYRELRAEHVTDHRSLFDRVELQLGSDSSTVSSPIPERLERVRQSVASVEATPRTPATFDDPALIELYFQFGRYLLIASSRPGSQPANLQGVWNELINPPWESKFTTNINLQMNYWPAEVTGLPECHEPLFDLIDDLRITGARTARTTYGARGWVLHHNTDLWRGTAPINNVDGVWPGGAAWLCHHLWEHHLFQEDSAFLRDRLYPALREASLFFLDTLVTDPKTGWLVVSPSHSPEQAPPGRALLTEGPAIDTQLVRSLFRRTVEASVILGVDSDLRTQLEADEKRIAPHQVGRHGQLREWLRDWDEPQNNHRHMSPLWALHPGREITPEDPGIFNAARTLLEHRGDGSTGWSMAWRMCLWARVFDGNMALRQLQLQLAKKTCPNLFDKCGPFQVDGNFGATAGIAEMLLQARFTKHSSIRIHLLPALPDAWLEGSVRGLRAPGGFELAFTWRSGRIESAELLSKRGRPCQICAGDRTTRLNTSPGMLIRLNAQLERVE